MRFAVKIAILTLICVALCTAEFLIFGNFDCTFIMYICGAVVGFLLGKHKRRNTK